jgi:hypothetical protein
VGQWRVSKFDKNKPSKIDFPKGEAGSGTAFLYLSLLSVTRGVTMPSYFLPIFPAGATVINDRLTFENKDGFITYFNFLTPIHRHHEKDTKHFRMIISDFCVVGVCRPCEIVRAFGVNERTLLRDIELFRKEGPAGFFKTVKRGGPRVVTDDIKPEIERLLGEGNSVKDVADELGIGHEALRKAIQRGKIQSVKKKQVNRRHLNH